MADPTDTPPESQIKDIDLAATDPAPAEEVTPALPEPPSVNVINPDGELVSIPQEQLSEAMHSGYRVADPGEVAQYAKEQKYGTPGQMAITAVEGAARGLAGPLATGFERAAGVNPEDIRGRQEVNPGVSLSGEVAGLVAPALVTGGTSALAKSGVQGAAKALPALEKAAQFTQAGLLTKAGEAGAKAMGLGGKGAGYLSQVGADTVKGAFEAALFQGGTEISKAFTEDPDQTAETAIANIGLASVMGGVFGGAIGLGLRAPVLKGLSKEADEIAPKFISEVDQAAVEAGDFAATIKHSNLIPEPEKESIFAGLKKEKANAKEIRAAADRLGAPIMEGMISESKLVQKAEDALINGAPTYSGIRRQALYKQGYDTAAGVVDSTLGDPSRYTKAELGNIFKDSIIKDIEKQAEPIARMYDEVKKYTSVIPLSERSAPAIARHIEGLQELRIAPSSPEGMLAKRVVKEIENLQTVDDVKAYKSILGRSLAPTASSGEKRMMGILMDKLTDLEEASIERAAKKILQTNKARPRVETTADVGGVNQFKQALGDIGNESKFLLSLIEQRKFANAQYKQFMTKLQPLAEQLGKRKVYGPQDAINYIREHLTPEDVVQRLFSKKDSEFLAFFSKEFPEQMELMREYQKGVLRAEASKTGTLSPKLLFNQVNKLEPEIQKAIFSADELARLKDAETYLRAMPENFNPSGTAHMSAFREFFEHPTGAIIANARDFGLEKFIKAVAASPDVKNAVELAKATIKGEKLAIEATKAVFATGKDVMPAAVISISEHREKLKKLVDDYQKHPDKIFAIGDNNPVPQYGQSFAQTSARALAYLESKKPPTDPKNPLDGKVVPNAFQEAAYNRALDTAQQPLIVLNRIREGTVTIADVEAIRTMYPKLYDKLAMRLQSEVIQKAEKGELVPYKTRIGLSIFLGKPLDSTMTPEGIQAAQPLPPPPSPQMGGAPKKSTSSLSKMPGLAQTPDQARQQGQASRTK